MFYKYIKPSNILADNIKHYWVLEINQKEAPVKERVIPTGNIELMFHYYNTFITENEILQKQQSRSLISGISNTYSDVRTNGHAGVIAVTFYPWGASNFFKFPLSEVANSFTNLADIYSKHIKQVEEQLVNCLSLEQRIIVIEQFLVQHLKPTNCFDDKFIKQSIQLINKSKGLINTSDLSSLLNVSAKSLERKFSMFLGQTPKQYLKIMRFQEALKLLYSQSEGNLTDLAYNLGYFDQAHFIKDFKQMAGYTPKEYLVNYPSCFENNV